MIGKILEAIQFAAIAHSGQERKYTKEPYLVHPLAVARLVLPVYHRSEDVKLVVVSAILHDVVEDTDVTIDAIYAIFGSHVAKIVYELTDDPNVEGNRPTRVAVHRERLAKAGPIAQTIKVADLIDNTQSIVKHDPKFARVYLKEKRDLLDVLTKADPILLTRAREQLARSMRRLDL